MDLNPVLAPRSLGQDAFLYDTNAPTLLETDGEWCKSLIKSLNSEVKEKPKEINHRSNNNKVTKKPSGAMVRRKRKVEKTSDSLYVKSRASFQT